MARMFGSSPSGAGMAALNVMPVRLSGPRGGPPGCFCCSGVGIGRSSMRTRWSTSSGVRM